MFQPVCRPPCFQNDNSSTNTPQTHCTHSREKGPNWRGKRKLAAGPNQLARNSAMLLVVILLLRVFTNNIAKCHNRPAFLFWNVHTGRPNHHPCQPNTQETVSVCRTQPRQAQAKQGENASVWLPKLNSRWLLSWCGCGPAHHTKFRFCRSAAFGFVGVLVFKRSTSCCSFCCWTGSGQGV